MLCYDQILLLGIKTEKISIHSVCDGVQNVVRNSIEIL